jgi:hypothetical protein
MIRRVHSMDAPTRRSFERSGRRLNAESVRHGRGQGRQCRATRSLDEDEKAYVEANIISNDVQGGRSPAIISEPGMCAGLWTFRTHPTREKADIRITEGNPRGGYIHATTDETPAGAGGVALALGYQWNGAVAIQHVPEEWRGVRSVLTPSVQPCSR